MEFSTFAKCTIKSFNANMKKKPNFEYEKYCFKKVCIEMLSVNKNYLVIHRILCHRKEFFFSHKSKFQFLATLMIYISHFSWWRNEMFQKNFNFSHFVTCFAPIKCNPNKLFGKETNFINDCHNAFSLCMIQSYDELNSNCLICRMCKYKTNTNEYELKESRRICSEFPRQKTACSLFCDILHVDVSISLYSNIIHKCRMRM